MVTQVKALDNSQPRPDIVNPYRPNFQLSLGPMLRCSIRFFDADIPCLMLSLISLGGASRKENREIKFFIIKWELRPFENTSIGTGYTF